MDPDTVYETMVDDWNLLEDRADAAAALIGWLNKNGYLPAKAIDPLETSEYLNRMHTRAVAGEILAKAWDAR